MSVSTGSLFLTSKKFLDDLNNKSKESQTPSISKMDNIVELVGLCLLLAVILFAAYYTSKFVAKMKLGELKSSNFHIIDTYRIGSNKMLQIVKIANKYVVIAIGKDTVTYITELEEVDVRIKDMDQEQKLNFAKVFEKLKSGNLTGEK